MKKLIGLCVSIVIFTMAIFCFVGCGVSDLFEDNPDIRIGIPADTDINAPDEPAKSPVQELLSPSDETAEYAAIG